LSYGCVEAGLLPKRLPGFTTHFMAECLPEVCAQVNFCRGFAWQEERGSLRTAEIVLVTFLAATGMVGARKNAALFEQLKAAV
jgi:hypothetical protein